MSTPNPLPRQVAEALENQAALERQARLKPTWDDVRSELGVRPVEQPDGTFDAGRIEGDKALRWLEMQKDYHLATAARADEREARIRRIPMMDAAGRLRMVAEEREDSSAVKHGSRRLFVPGRRKHDWSEGHEVYRDGRWQRYERGQWVDA